MRITFPTLATVLFLGVLSVAATRLVAMRVEVEGLRPAGDETVVALTVQIAPEDRTRVGRNAWLRAALEQGESTIDRVDRAVEVDADGRIQLEAHWPPGSFRLRVEVESAQGGVNGIWADAIVVPRIETDAIPAAPATPAPLPQPTELPSAGPLPAPSPTAAPPSPEPPATGAPAAAAPPALPPDPGLAEMTITATAGNRPVLDLDLRGLRLKVGGERTPIESLVGSPDAPLSVVLAVDLSSVSGDALRRARQYLGRLALRLHGDGADLHLLSLDGRAKSVAGWGASSAHITDALEKLGSTGDGDLTDALTTAITLLEPRAGRRLIVLVTDGGDTAAATDWKVAIESARTSGAPVLIIGFDGDHLTRRTRRALQATATASGGTSWFLRDSETLKLVADHYADLAHSSYALGFRRPPGSGNHALRIRVDPVDDDMEIRHPEALSLPRGS